MAAPVKRIFILALLALTAAGAEEYIGKLSELNYDVSGKVYKVDDKTIMIKDFNYNGGVRKGHDEVP